LSCPAVEHPGQGQTGPVFNVTICILCGVSFSVEKMIISPSREFYQLKYIGSMVEWKKKVLMP